MKKLLNTLSLFCLLAFMLLYNGTHAQEDKPDSKASQAKQNLRVLRDHALLVRLPNYTLKREALQKAGRDKEMRELELQIKTEKKDIRLAFLKTYTFGKIYFYEDYDYKAIESGNLEGVLTNFEGETIVKEALPKQYLVGSFSATEKLDLDAFVVMDKNFILLDPPFPYYQRTRYFLSLLTYSKAQVIELWNRRLFSKYAAWFGVN